MDCKEVNRMIPDFLNKEMESRELKGFMEHISTCKECKEELSIQFLIKEGLASLEDGSTFDLQSELERLLEEAERRMRLRRGIHFIIYGIEIMVILTIIAIIILIIVL